MTTLTPSQKELLRHLLEVASDEGELYRHPHHKYTKSDIKELITLAEFQDDHWIWQEFASR